MTNEQDTKAEKPSKPDAPKTVTSDRDADFPSLGWSIRAGETKELPKDAEAAKHILLNHHITLNQ